MPVSPLRFLYFAAVSSTLLAHSFAPTIFASQVAPAADVDALVHHGEELNNQGKYADALGEFQKALDRDATISYALFRTAESQFKLGDLNAAASALRAALKGDRRPEWIRVWSYLNLGKIYDIRGQRYRALPMYQAARDTTDDSFSAQAEAKKCMSRPCEERRIVWPSP